VPNLSPFPAAGSELARAPDLGSIPPAREKLAFIFNRHSGRGGRNARFLPQLREFIAAQSLDAGVFVTEGPGHATILAREAIRRGCGRVVAVGGDGTVNEVAQALRDTPAALAIVPSGSGNGLARHLRLPANPRKALQLAVGARAHIRAFDTGSVNGRPFFNAMGFGLDAEISRRFNHLVRRGLPAYLRTTAAAFAQRQPERCVIEAAGRSVTGEFLLIAIANSDQYGNGAILAPGARADDGQLDLIAVRPVGALGAALLGLRLFLGTFDRSPRVLRLRGGEFQLRRPAPGILHTDGEVHPGEAMLRVAVHPGSLKIAVP
jgi:diacylglycerol kinase (ATP)